MWHHYSQSEQTENIRTDISIIKTINYRNHFWENFQETFQVQDGWGGWGGAYPFTAEFEIVGVRPLFAFVIRFSQH